MSDGQTNIAQNPSMSEEEAAKQDEMNSPFFTPGSNMRYAMQFTMKECVDKQAPDQKSLTGRLVECVVPVFDAAGQKTAATEKKIIRQMNICTFAILGKDEKALSAKMEPCEKLWRMKSKKWRELFRPYAEAGSLANPEKVFQIEIKGELNKTNYSVVVLDKP